MMNLPAHPGEEFQDEEAEDAPNVISEQLHVFPRMMHTRWINQVWKSDEEDALSNLKGHRSWTGGLWSSRWRTSKNPSIMEGPHGAGFGALADRHVFWDVPSPITKRGSSGKASTQVFTLDSVRRGVAPRKDLNVKPWSACCVVFSRPTSTSRQTPKTSDIWKVQLEKKSKGLGYSRTLSLS